MYAYFDILLWGQLWVFTVKFVWSGRYVGQIM